VSLSVYLDRFLPMIEKALRDELHCSEEMFPYYGMMQYHMGWLDEHLQPVEAARGKRLRPLLCLLACEAVGGQAEWALPAAAAIELLHNFSLIHDDIEDDSETRRHRTTVWKLWGIAHGINSGDGMFAKAIRLLGQLQERSVGLERALNAQCIFAETCVELTEGQYLDMAFESHMDVDLEGYLEMIRGKSAALIACSVRIGALLGGAEDSVVLAYHQFGENLGLAFQVVDDILGIWGSEKRTGKSACADILTRKKTLPVVYALGDGGLRALYAKKTLTEQDVERVVRILETHGAREFAEGLAGEYSERAMDSLAQAGPETPARKAMRDLASSLLTRTY